MICLPSRHVFTQIQVQSDNKINLTSLQGFYSLPVTLSDEFIVTLLYMMAVFLEFVP